MSFDIYTQGLYKAYISAMNFKYSSSWDRLPLIQKNAWYKVAEKALLNVPIVTEQHSRDSFIYQRPTNFVIPKDQKDSFSSESSTGDRIESE